MVTEDGSALIELMIDPDQQHVPKAINKRDENGKTVQSSFEDMYPFLSQDEVNENLI